MQILGVAKPGERTDLPGSQQSRYQTVALSATSTFNWQSTVCLWQNCFLALSELNLTQPLTITLQVYP